MIICFLLPLYQATNPVCLLCFRFFSLFILFYFIFLVHSSYIHGHLVEMLRHQQAEP